MSQLIKKILIVIALLAALAAGTLAFLTAPYVATPVFTVTNDSSVSVEVTAHWREEAKSLGILKPGDKLKFEVNDEAAMEFKATKPDGKVLTSAPPVYFTTGTSATAVVKESSIDVSTQL